MGIFPCAVFFLFTHMKKICFLLFIITLVSCSTSRTVYTEYGSVPSWQPVVDSIYASGTEVGPFSMWRFVNDEGKHDSVSVAALYKKGKSTGSVQIRMNENRTYNVKLIDVVNKKKKK